MRYLYLPKKRRPIDAVRYVDSTAGYQYCFAGVGDVCHGFFYPADFTFVCPTELEDLANKYEEFKKIGCEIYSVSCDTHFVHKAWHDASDTIKKIQYPMLADPTGALARDFDVMIEADGLAERGSFIVNPEGKIVAYEVIAGNVGRNADELLRRVQASQFVAEHGDQVCPAKWQPGASTLKPSLDLVGII